MDSGTMRLFYLHGADVVVEASRILCHDGAGEAIDMGEVDMGCGYLLYIEHHLGGQGHPTHPARERLHPLATTVSSYLSSMRT